MIEPGIAHLLKCLTSLADRLEPHEFLNILSAWRGPDNSDFSVKEETTEIIRREILNECEPAAEEFLSGSTFYGNYVARRIAPMKINYNPGDSYHFYNHIRWAAENLNLQIKE